jgi:hypothetical protein
VVQVIKWADVAGSLSDDEVLTLANLPGLNTTTQPQPTSGNRWQWNAARGCPDRLLDAVSGNYIRGDDTGGTDAAALRWFDWNGDPGANINLLAFRDSSDAQTFGIALASNGHLTVTYGSSVYGAYIDMTGMDAGTYAAQVWCHAVATPDGYVRLALYDEALTQVGTTVETASLDLARTDLGHCRFGGATTVTDYTTDTLGGLGIAWGIITAGDDLRDLFASTPVVYFIDADLEAVPAELWYVVDVDTAVRVDLEAT